MYLVYEQISFEKTTTFRIQKFKMNELHVSRLHLQSKLVLRCVGPNIFLKCPLDMKLNIIQYFIQ